MKNERILPYKMSQKLTAEELESISAAGMTSTMTANGTHTAQGWDACVDAVVDL